MVIPVMALIIGLTFFFGWSMDNQQHVKISDRYATWRELLNRADWARDPNYANREPEVTSGTLNDLFFSQRASQVTIDRNNGPSETLRGLVDYVGTGSGRAEAFAQTMVMDLWPRGLSTEVGADVPATVSLWQQLGLTGPIKAQHGRDGLQWRLREAHSPWDPLRDQFLLPLDSVLTTIPVPGDLWGRTMRGLYASGW